jgi:hypothetical protein
VRYYAGRVRYWQKKLGVVGHIVKPAGFDSACPRYLAKALRRKAAALHALWHYEYAWWDWMPAKHQRVAACETGHQGGDGPGGSRFDWDSGTYVSAFGIYRAGYNDDAHRIGNLGWDETIAKLHRYPTPREQMQAADSHRARWGDWSGWGCRGA